MNSRWLPFFKLIGLRMKMSVEYATLPLLFRGASSMSVMRAFRGSAGSSSPKAVPRSFSYWPVVPNARPPNVGDCERAGSTTMCVMRASAAGAVTSVPAARASAIARPDAVRRVFPMVTRESPVSVVAFMGFLLQRVDDRIFDRTRFDSSSLFFRRARGSARTRPCVKSVAQASCDCARPGRSRAIGARWFSRPGPLRRASASP